MDKRQSLMLMLGSLPVAWTCSSIYTNQKIASLLEYQPALYGRLCPTGVGESYFYMPFAWVGWYQSFGSNKIMQKLFDEYAFEPLYTSTLIGFMIASLIVVRFREKKNDTHGSAHFATKKEIYDFGHFPDNRKLWEICGDGLGHTWDCLKGLLLGGGKGRGAALSSYVKWLGSESRKTNDNNLLSGDGIFLGYLDDGTYLRDNAKTHTLLIAPTRSGKGVGHIIPTLLTWKGSTVVTDVKGENWALTSGYRKSQLGNDVFMFKPMAADSCHYNPLGEIRIGTHHEMGDLQLVTKILVDPTGKGSEGENAHWVDNAWQLLQGVVLHLLYQKKYHNFKIGADGKPEPIPGRTANLSDVLDFLYDDQDGAESDLDAEHKKFLAALKREGKNFNPEAGGVSDGRSEEEKIAEAVPQNQDRFYNGMGGENSPICDDFVNNMDEVTEPAIVDENGDPAPEEESGSASGSAAGNSGNGSGEAEAENEPKLKTIDGEEIGGDGDNEAAGLEGFQKKIKRFITDYRFAMRKNEAGEWEDYAAPYCHAPDDDKDLFTRLYPDKVSREGLHPHVRQIFQAMIDKPDKEFGSIMSTLDTALIIYRNPVLVKNISESDLVMKDLMDCEKPISLYLVFGPGEIDVVRPLCRVIVEMMWRLNVEEMKFVNGKMLEHKHRLLMLLDEFPALGKMGGIEQSEGFLAGYGIKLMIIAQDINQINSLYGKDNYVISNCQVQIYHAPSDNNSARYLSDKLGNKTEKQVSTSRNSAILPMPNSYNDSYMSRPLMYADEVSRLSDKKLLLFCKGLAPILCNKIRYFEDEVFAPRVKIKAPDESDKITPEKRLWDYSDYALLQKNSVVEEYKYTDDVDELDPVELYEWVGDNGESETVPCDVIENWLNEEFASIVKEA